MAERIIYNKGGIEYLVSDLTDRLENVTDLAGMNTRYDIRAEGAGSWIVQAQPASVNLLEVSCLVDTTDVAYVSGVYELFIQFDNPPESPRIGPIRFEVNE